MKAKCLKLNELIPLCATGARQQTDGASCNRREEETTRCYGSRSCVWSGLSSCSAHHSSWRYFVLRYRVRRLRYRTCTVSHYNDSNADLIFLKRGMELVTDKLAVVIHRLSAWSEQHKDLACLGWTHFQPAQLVTVGKRGTLWLQVSQLQFALIAQLKDRIR